MSDVFKILRNAVYLEYRNQSTLNESVQGDMWPGVAPDGHDTFPYIIYSVSSAPPEYTFDSRIEMMSADFTIYSNSESEDEVDNIFSKLTTVYDDVVLTVTGFKMVRCDRQSSLPLWIPETATWQLTVSYNIMM